eukprot:4717392-Prorocentrum_lima.AAC.1
MPPVLRGSGRAIVAGGGATRRREGESKNPGGAWARGGKVGRGYAETPHPHADCLLRLPAGVCRSPLK